MTTLPDVTFAALADFLESRGIEVGIALTESGHALVLHDAMRALRFDVVGDFDRTATALVLSASLQLQLVPQTVAGLSPAYDWPELHAFWAELRA